jgi:hypothetical protein
MAEREYPATSLGWHTAQRLAGEAAQTNGDWDSKPSATQSVVPNHFKFPLNRLFTFIIARLLCDAIIIQVVC